MIILTISEIHNKMTNRSTSIYFQYLGSVLEMVIYKKIINFTLFAMA